VARVLIVDDEPGIRVTAVRALRDAGHEAEAAADLAEAGVLMAGTDYDVVLADLLMPGGGGLRLLEQIQDGHPFAEVVIFTGQPSVDSATEALRLRAFDYLQKPVDRKTLLRVVARAGEAAGLKRENARLVEENRRHREELETRVAERTAELRLALERLSMVQEAARSRDYDPGVFSQSEDLHHH